MTRVKQGLESLNRYAGGLMVVSFVGVIMPMLVLSGYGVYNLIAHGYAIHLAVLLMLSVLLIFIPRWLWSLKANDKEVQGEDEAFVEASPDWSDAEQQIWDAINLSIENKLEQESDWASLKRYSLEIAAEVAREFGKQELDFTVPEALQLLEEISRRYRRVINDHVPAVDVIKVSQFKWLYDVNDKYGEQAKTAGKNAMLAWRLFRAANPVAAAASELRRGLLNSLTDQVSENLQRNAKRALLQEVGKVCIELYSGRYTIDSISVSRVSQQDEQRRRPEVEPVRVAIVGQLSAGKSSLVNALTHEINAQVDALPATDDVRVYQCSIEGEEQLSLVDMPGLDGSQRHTARALKQITQSDLVLWVLKANQSSRQLDVELLAQVNDFYQSKDNVSCKRPKMVGVLNQVDKLKPAGEWIPPYDLDDLSSPKAQTIRAALDFNLSRLSVDEIHPLGMPEGGPLYGLDRLEAEIQAQCDHAKNVQLNRQSQEAKGAAGLAGQGRRLFKAGGEIVKNML